MYPLRRAARRAAALLITGMAAGACGTSNTASLVATTPTYEPVGQTKSSAARSQAEPLIVEWPAAARTKLEALAKRGLVAVRYTGQEMEVLAQCRAAGEYVYVPTTRQHERVTIQSSDALYANLPLGAASLEGKLKSAGQLNVTMTIVGVYRAEGAAALQAKLDGECARATHVVSGLTVGAFSLFTGSGAELFAGASVGPGDTGARSESRREVLNEAGDEKACAAATREDQAPPFGCGALVRVEVQPLAPVVVPSAEPKPPAKTDPAAPSEPALPPPIPPKAEVICPAGTAARDGQCEPIVMVGPENAGAASCRAVGASCPEPGSSDGMAMGIIVGSLLLTSLTIGIIVGVTTKDAPAPVVAPAGLGTAPVSRPLSPVVRW